MNKPVLSERSENRPAKQKQNSSKTGLLARKRSNSQVHHNNFSFWQMTSSDGMGTTRRKVRRIFRMDLERQLCRVTSSGMRFSHKNFLPQFSRKHCFLLNFLIKTQQVTIAHSNLRGHGSFCAWRCTQLLWCRTRSHFNTTARHKHRQSRLSSGSLLIHLLTSVGGCHSFKDLGTTMINIH